MPRPPVPVHRGFTPEQLRRRQLAGRAIGVAAIAGVGWVWYWELTHEHGAPHSLRGWLGVGAGMAFLYLVYHWFPKKVDQLLEPGPPIKLTPDKPPRADRWYRRP